MKVNQQIMLFCLFLISVGFCQETTKKTHCSIRTRIINHGVKFEPRKCFICTCLEAKLHCADMEPEDCVEPECGHSLAVSTPDRCCKVCPGTGARCRFNGMSVEDGEFFKQDPKGSCKCQAGNLTCA